MTPKQIKASLRTLIPIKQPVSSGALPVWQESGGVAGG